MQCSAGYHCSAHFCYPIADAGPADAVPADTPRTEAALPDHAVADLVAPDTQRSDSGSTPDALGARCGDGIVNAGSGEQCDELTPACNASCRVNVVSLANDGEHTCFLRGDHALKCFGLNSDGQLGIDDLANRGVDGGMGNGLPRAGGDLEVREIAIGVRHSCAVRVDNSVVCWGKNEKGELGLGISDPVDHLPRDLDQRVVDLGTAIPPAQIACGQRHTCVLFGTAPQSFVKCWGYNLYGRLGLGDVDDRGDSAGEMGGALPPIDLDSSAVLAIAAGGGTTCALLDGVNSNVVKCWGLNTYGQLGGSDINHHGATAAGMGAGLPAVDLGVGARAIAITVGNNHACALLDGSPPRVKCWGYNVQGQLGLGDTLNRGDDCPGGNPPSCEMGDNLPAVKLGANARVLQVTAGASHTCALLDGTPRSVKCWGFNSHGQLGVGDSLRRGAGVDGGCPDANANCGMGDDLPAVELGAGGGAVEIWAGRNDTCARLANGAIKCWGENTSGQLGLGDTNDRGEEGGEMGDALPPVDIGTVP